MPPAQTTTPYLKYTKMGWETQETGVITETPVSLTINGTVWLTLMCTPADLDALAVGFLYNEEIIHSLSDIADLRVCDNQQNVDIWLKFSVEKPQHWRRTSGCGGGLTGQAPEAIRTVTPLAQFSPEQVLRAMQQMLSIQELYRLVRGVHCSALSDGENIRLFAEDIGRHNTLDKLCGMLLLHPTPLEQCLVVTTGRISSEMLQKTARIGAQVLISRTSPSSLSIQLAREKGITLIGYARRSEFTVYTHAERLLEGAACPCLPLRRECCDHPSALASSSAR